MATALAGVRIIDLTDESGVFATRLLADLGADVIRVEAPDGDRVRNFGPYLGGRPDPERSYYHLFHNANKRSVGLDFESTDGRANLDSLLATADVCLTSGPTLDLEGGGLAPSQLLAGNPGLIAVTITPFGWTGPWRTRLGSDLIGAASGGLLYPSGGEDDPPMHGNADPSFKMAALQAVAGALIALQRRNSTGMGSHVDISVQEATLMAMVQQLNPNLYTREGQVPTRHGLFGPLFRCQDGRWVAIRVRPDRFKRFLDWAARDGVNTELREESLPQLQRGGADINTAQEVTEVLRRVVTALTLEQALEIAWGLDLIALPVGRFDEMASQKHFAVTNQFREVIDPPLGPSVLNFARSPFDGMAGGVDIRPAPILGQHTEEVLAERPLHRDTRKKVGAVEPNPAMPLAGLRIIDFTWVLAGPFGTRILANFGAEVIRIESHTKPDSTRTGVPKGASTMDAGYLFNDANTGKKSLTLDLRRPEARELILKLVSKADAVTNNYRPGALDRMGFGYEVLRAVKPDIVLVSLPGCGSVGPWADKGTLGGVLMAASGLNDISGFEGRPPFGIATAFPDFTSPYLLASSVIAAIRERDRTSRGQHVEVNQLAASVGLLGAEWMRFSAEGSLPRNANRSENYCPHGVFPSSGPDAWVAIAVGDGPQWERFARAIGRPELAKDARFESLAARKANEDLLEEIVMDWTRARDKWDAAQSLQSAGVAAAAVATLAELLEKDPQLRHRMHYQRLHQPSEPAIELSIDGEAIHLDGPRELKRAPMMGEYNSQVLSELLGLTDVEFDNLVLTGVVN